MQIHRLSRQRKDIEQKPKHLFSRGHATLHLAVSVGKSVRHIFEFRVVFALLLLPNRPRLSCRVSGLVCITAPAQMLG